MRYALDLETECTVVGCAHHGRSLCAEGHSLSPWHSKITVIGLVGDDGTRKVFRKDKLDKPDATLQLKLFLWDEDYTIVGHNFKFDALHLARHGFEIPLERWVGDSQLAAYVLTEKIPDSWLEEYDRKRTELGGSHRKAGKHSLKTLAPYHLGVEAFWEVEHHDDDAYVLKDTEYTLKLVDVLEARLKELDQFTFYKERQLEWTKMLLTAEMRGIEFDSERAKEVESNLQTRSDELKKRLDTTWAKAHKAYVAREMQALAQHYRALTQAAIKKIKTPSEEKIQRTAERYEHLFLNAQTKLPTELSYDSPTQMKWLLKEFLGYDITGFDDEEGTGAEILERLANEGKDDVGTYLEWRKTNKILTAFLPSYKDLATHDESGRTVLHPIFNPDTTRTGRLSSERPNCQQVTGSLKGLFKARNGYTFIGYDAAAIEAKLIALYSADQQLFNIISTGTSLHDFNTVNYFGLEGVPYSDVKKKYARHREAAKNVGFALFYNAGANRIRISMAEKGFLLPIDECKRIHKRFKEAFGEAITYGNQVVAEMENGQVIPNLLGRPLAIENPEDAYMKAFNKLIQSSASDLNLEGAYDAWMEFKKNKIDATPILFVHDYVCFEVKNEQAEQADEILRNALTNFDLSNSNGRINLTVEGGRSSRWEK